MIIDFESHKAKQADKNKDRINLEKARRDYEEAYAAYENIYNQMELREDNGHEATAEIEAKYEHAKEVLDLAQMRYEKAQEKLIGKDKAAKLRQFEEENDEYFRDDDEKEEKELEELKKIVKS